LHPPAAEEAAGGSDDASNQRCSPITNVSTSEAAGEGAEGKGAGRVLGSAGQSTKSACTPSAEGTVTAATLPWPSDPGEGGGGKDAEEESMQTSTIPRWRTKIKQESASKRESASPPTASKRQARSHSELS
jgi:hypothetical protein